MAIYRIHVSAAPESHNFTCHIYRQGQLAVTAQGGTANNAVRLARSLLKGAR